MTISALPTPPSRDDPANFKTRADSFLGALPTFQSEANALSVEMNGYRDEAAESATTATNQAGIATAQAAAAAASVVEANATANCTKWVSGTSYGQGANVWSPVDYQTYRRKSAGSGTTDPSADPANWALLGTTAVTYPSVAYSVGGTL